MSFYNGIRVCFQPFIKVLYRLHVHGRENIPAEGGLIVCSNHVSAADVIFLTVAVPKRQIHYMAKAELFKIPLLKQFMKGMGAFPIKRGVADISSIKKTIKFLRDKEVVGIFPQGTRCNGVHPRETEVKAGVGMIAWRAGSDVLPVAIITKKYKVRMFRRVDVIIGKPIPYDELGFEAGNHEEQEKVSQRIFDEMIRLHEEGVPQK